MPPKLKTDTGTATAPASSVSLCDICPAASLDPSTTAWGCEHGTWTFTEPAEPALPAGASPEEQLATLLSNLDHETLQKLLDLKAAANASVEVPTLSAADQAKAEAAAKSAAK